MVDRTSITFKSCLWYGLDLIDSIPINYYILYDYINIKRKRINVCLSFYKINYHIIIKLSKYKFDKLYLYQYL